MKTFTYRIALGDTIRGNLGFCFDVTIESKKIPTKPQIIDKAMQFLRQWHGEAITVDMLGQADPCLYLAPNARTAITIEDGDEFYES